MRPTNGRAAIFKKAGDPLNMELSKRNGRQTVQGSLQPTPEAAKSRLAQRRRKQLMVQLDLKRAMLAQQDTVPPAPDPLGP